MNKININNRNKGFTLLEILLVVAAIGILAAVVLVAINPNRQINQAKQAAINSEKNTIEKALQQILIDTGGYPSDIDEVQKEVCKTGTQQTGGDINCSNKADLRALVPTYISSIPAGATYTVAKSNDGRVYVNTTTTAANLTCPTGYIKVPGNSLYQTKDFCVMKYEAKAVDINNPTVGLTTPNTGYDTIDNNDTTTTASNGRTIASVASGYPLTNLEQQTASMYCNNVGASLISNAEWMTIARNIEGVASNWYSPSPSPGINKVGEGGLFRGHTDSYTSINYNKALISTTDDNDGYFGTGNNINNGWDQKRNHILTNGEFIWDLSGNTWEWVSDTISQLNQPYSSGDAGWAWRQYDTITSNGIFRYDDYRPSNPTWNSNKNVGALFSYGPNNLTNTKAFLRGGEWNNFSAAGIFTLGLSNSPTGKWINIGFRCVIR